MKIDLRKVLTEKPRHGSSAAALVDPPPPQVLNPPSRISRRRLLQLGAGAGIAAVLSPLPRLSTARASASDTANATKTPNIIVLMTAGASSYALALRMG